MIKFVHNKIRIKYIDGNAAITQSYHSYQVSIVAIPPIPKFKMINF